MKSRLLNSEEIISLSQDLPNWEIKADKLTRTLKFSNFIEAFAFMTKVAIISEGINHHPDWSNSYANVKIELTSHDLGGISQADIQLANRINELVN